MSSSKRARRRRRHLRFGKPKYSLRDGERLRRVDYVIIDEVTFDTQLAQAGDGAE